jgi:hypothetical protein
MPVSSPSAISGRISSVDAPNAYAAVANTHKEPMVHNAIARESGSLSMRSLSGRCWKEKLLPAPPRPVGVISLEAMSGDSIPTQTMLRWLIARSRLRSGHHHHQAELLASWLQPTRKWAVLFGVQFERRLTATGSKGQLPRHDHLKLLRRQSNLRRAKPPIIPGLFAVAHLSAHMHIDFVRVRRRMFTFGCVLKPCRALLGRVAGPVRSNRCQDLIGTAVTVTPWGVIHDQSAYAPKCRGTWHRRLCAFTDHV